MTAELQAIVDLIALERDAIQYLTQRGFKVSRPKKAKESKEPRGSMPSASPTGLHTIQLQNEV